MIQHLANSRSHRSLLVAVVATGLGCNAEGIASPTATPATVPAVVATKTFAGGTLASAWSADDLFGMPSAIEFGTYEGSGEVVHPDVVSFSAPWYGHRYWNAITPYPNSAIQFENPSVFVSNDGNSWAVPAGMKNPLARTDRGYLSDPDMVFEPTRGELWLYYREVEMARIANSTKPHIADHVWLTTSADAVRWSTPRRVVTDSVRYVVSPSIVRTPDGSWHMFQIDAGLDGCSAKSSRVVVRTSSNGIKWSTASDAGLVQPGYVAWHMDVQYVAERAEYWALVAAYVSGQGCTNTSLFLVTSPDGRKWTSYPSPVLARGELPQFSSAVYRSTFAYGADNNVTIWYSGARIAKLGSKKRPATLAWSAAVSHTTAGVLLARVRDKTRAKGFPVASIRGDRLAPASMAP